MYYSEMNSPVGNLLLLGDGTALTGLYMHDQKYRPPLPAGCRRDDRLFAPVRAQLEAYFAGERRRFDVRLSPRGTPFQQAVWQALCDIPYGATESYGALAARIGRQGASRAVGLANGHNPIGIIVPCHRVLGADGSLTGYGGGIERKRWLLDCERRHAAAGQLSFDLPGLD
ncbi:methylated-DNA--[protein]-cysteine S-methyltransferase [Stutzerimonas azotifigens]|uniref:methylated-DNA--[protein]-cysteine S-methyltransferase n=1 Tax=Stutzerimonas azotifigens TaxID=291995 RepID=UPI0003FC6C75|nr:methylated-DNA--[protein]-cysteine S-methyltransferase [Stutzerimonas azotifigens]